MDLERLSNTLAAGGEPAYRAKQVWEWAARGAAGYADMTNLPAALRKQLEAEVPFSTLALEREARADDGTVKALFTTSDGRPIEAVLMRYRDGRRSICVSSQSGCPLTCTFCATGQMKFGRNLTSSEILDQVLHFRRIEPVDHLVFMGMGEPMMNLDNVLAACERLPDVGITHRRTGVSTVGWVPGIDRLAETDMPIRLALSLHAADETLRSELMPVNDPKIFKVNLIPFNPTDSIYTGSGREAIAAFKAALEERGLRATVRLTRGRDIDAACGQLAAKAAA